MRVRLKNNFIDHTYIYIDIYIYIYSSIYAWPKIRKRSLHTWKNYVVFSLKDLVLYNTIIGTCSSASDWQPALELLCKQDSSILVARGCSPVFDSFSFFFRFDFPLCFFFFFSHARHGRFVALLSILLPDLWSLT